MYPTKIKCKPQQLTNIANIKKKILDIEDRIDEVKEKTIKAMVDSIIITIVEEYRRENLTVHEAMKYDADNLKVTKEKFEAPELEYYSQLTSKLEARLEELQTDDDNSVESKKSKEADPEDLEDEDQHKDQHKDRAEKKDKEGDPNKDEDPDQHKEDDEDKDNDKKVVDDDQDKKEDEEIEEDEDKKVEDDDQD